MRRPAAAAIGVFRHRRAGPGRDLWPAKMRDPGWSGQRVMTVGSVWASAEAGLQAGKNDGSCE
jgi:hypothetical protein